MTFKAKLDAREVTEVKRLLDQGISQRELAKRFGVNRSVIGDINRGVYRTAASRTDKAQPDANKNKPKGVAAIPALTQAQAEEIRNLFAAGNSSKKELANKFRISTSTVLAIIRGERYKK